MVAEGITAPAAEPGSARCSVLFPDDGGAEGVAGRAQPEFFRDLNLDQVIADVTAGRQAYRLEPLFYTPLRDPALIAYRQDVFRDLADQSTAAALGEFTRAMREVRATVARAQRFYYDYQRQRWHIEAVATYCTAVTDLAESLESGTIASSGLTGLRAYLSGYVSSPGFTALRTETSEVKAALAGVSYCLKINGNRITVSRYEGEEDYSAQIERTFAKFRQGGVRDYRVHVPSAVEMNHVEAKVLDIVVQLVPGPFRALDAYCRRHGEFLDETVERFDREIQFYLAYLQYTAPMRSAGLPFCYPDINTESKEVSATETFDIALAAKLAFDSTVVRNDFYLTGPERILVVSGPNQGGKTTLARTFGQLHFLASIGCPVPGRAARLSLCDEILTHFEREEKPDDLNGMLGEELVRIRDTLTRATGDSILILNEAFSSTALEDALQLGRAVLKRISHLGALCVYVTFVDELASLDDTTVSMVSTVVEDDPAQRTYRLVRRPANGLAYAAAIAEKYGLTYDVLRKRVSA